MTENMSKEDMVKEAVEEAKAKAAKEQAEAEETVETEDAQGVEAEAKEATEEATETEGDSEAASEGKKKFFGKKEKKDKKDEKIEELTDRVTRQMAEFDNFRKRTEKEKSQMYEVGAKDIIEKILPVVDNFERGLDAVKEEEKEKYIMLRNSIKEDLKDNFISEEEYWQYNKEYSDKIKKIK